MQAASPSRRHRNEGGIATEAALNAMHDSGFNHGLLKKSQQNELYIL